MTLRIILLITVFYLMVIVNADEVDDDRKERLAAHLEVIKKYPGGEPSLNCFQQRNKTETAGLVPCSYGQFNTITNLVDPELLRYPACLGIKVRGSLVWQGCQPMESIELENCGPTCIEKVHWSKPFISTCCCTTPGCNGQMLPATVTTVDEKKEEKKNDVE